MTKNIAAFSEIPIGAYFVDGEFPDSTPPVSLTANPLWKKVTSTAYEYISVPVKELIGKVEKYEGRKDWPFIWAFLEEPKEEEWLPPVEDDGFDMMQILAKM